MENELNKVNEKLSHAIYLLSEAYGMLGSVHCYDTDLYRNISDFLFGNEE